MRKSDVVIRNEADKLGLHRLQRGEIFFDNPHVTREVTKVFGSIERIAQGIGLVWTLESATNRRCGTSLLRRNCSSAAH